MTASQCELECKEILDKVKSVDMDLQTANLRIKAVNAVVNINNQRLAYARMVRAAGPQSSLRIPFLELPTK